MDHYKQVKTHGLTANTRLVLIDAANKHKGFSIIGSGAANVKLEFVSGGTFSAGITLAPADPLTNQIPGSIVPIRLAAITPDATGGKIILFN